MCCGGQYSTTICQELSPTHVTRNFDYLQVRSPIGCSDRAWSKRDVSSMTHEMHVKVRTFIRERILSVYCGSL